MAAADFPALDLDLAAGGDVEDVMHELLAVRAGLLERHRRLALAAGLDEEAIAARLRQVELGFAEGLGFHPEARRR